MAFITLPEATRVAMPLASAGKTGMSRVPAGGQFAAHGLLQFAARDRETLARTRQKLAVPFRFRLRAPRRALRENARAPRSGMQNGGSVGQPRFCLVRRTSSAPSGEPCASNVSCLCGEP